jgi:C1A family cysteine protease
MKTQRETSTFLGIGLAALLAGCGTPEGALDDLPAMDDDPPLADVDTLKKDSPKNDAIPLEGDKTDAQLPAYYDLGKYMTPVKSQARRGVCSIFSSMGLVEMLYKKRFNQTFDFSEQYLQWSVKSQVGAFTNTSGSTDYYNLQAVYKYGVPLESAWVYEPDQWDQTKDPACTGEAMPTRCYTNGSPPATAVSATKYKLPSAGRWVNTSSIKNVIYEKGAGVVVGLDFFYQSWNHRRSTLPTNPTYWNRGYVLYPNAKDRTESYKQRAGHSVQLIGWDDNLEVQTVDEKGQLVVDAQGKPVKEKGFFIFKNSWGTTGFGIQHRLGPGYGYISYRYVRDYGSGYTADPPVRLP